MQATLASRSGVSLATVRRFERDGQITLANFLRLTQALGVLDELADRFEPPSVRSIDELAAASRSRSRSGCASGRRRRGQSGVSPRSVAVGISSTTPTF